MGLYYITYLYKGSIVAHDISQIEKTQNIISINPTHHIVYMPNSIFKLSSINPIIDQYDKAQGFVKMDELICFARRSPDILEALNKDNSDWKVCEIEWSTLDNTSRITCNLPVYADADTNI